MKKLFLALIALSCAIAVSSCCDQSYCPGNRKYDERDCRRQDEYQIRRNTNDETPYRWDQQNQNQQGQERQHRRW